MEKQKLVPIDVRTYKLGIVIVLFTKDFDMEILEEEGKVLEFDDSDQALQYLNNKYQTSYDRDYFENEFNMYIMLDPRC